MKKFKEIFLILFASLCGVSIAVFSSKAVGERELDMIMIYGCILVISFMAWLIFFYNFLKRRYKGTIYIAYSSKDNDIANYFKDNLCSLGYKCLPEEDSYKLGDNIYERMDRELNRSNALLAIISSNSKGMKTVNQSIKLMKKKKKKVLPILVGDVEIPHSLSGILSADYDSSPQQALYLVLDALGETPN